MSEVLGFCILFGYLMKRTSISPLPPPPGRNLPRFTESNVTVQQWVRTHFGGRSSTPQGSSNASGTATSSTLSKTAAAATTIEMNGAPAHGHIANAEKEGRYTKANSPICDNRSRNKTALPGFGQVRETPV